MTQEQIYQAIAKDLSKFAEDGYVAVRYLGVNPDMGEVYCIKKDACGIMITMNELMQAGVITGVGINFV